MVVDTSALLAVYLDEPDSGRFETALVNAPVAFISAGTLLEAAIVVEARHGKAGAVELDRRYGDSPSSPSRSTPNRWRPPESPSGSTERADIRRA